MSWAAKQAMMNVQMRKDKKAIEEAASKKGLYGSIGSTLGTLAALALMPTGVGALAAGAYAGLGSLAGGVVGAEGLTSAKNKNILKLSLFKRPFGPVRALPGVSGGIL